MVKAVGGAVAVQQRAGAGAVADAEQGWLVEVPKGQRHQHEAEVKAMQRQLKAAGFDPGPADGWFGPRTAAAVKRFQQARGLKVDAKVGPKTQAALGQARPGKAAPADSPNKKGSLALPGAPVPVADGPVGPLPEGSLFDNRDAWFLSQQPGPYNPNEDAPGNGNCGPSAVTMCARAFGVLPLGRDVVDAQVEETRKRIGESQSEYSGTSIAGLEKAARSYGLTASTMSGVHGAEQIQAELAKGHLVIAHVKATYLRPNPRTGHYTVVTAIKDGKVYLNDSSNKAGPIVISEADFWHGVAARGSYTMISVGP